MSIAQPIACLFPKVMLVSTLVFLLMPSTSHCSYVGCEKSFRFVTKPWLVDKEVSASQFARSRLSDSIGSRSLLKDKRDGDIRDLQR